MYSHVEVRHVPLLVIHVRLGSAAAGDTAADQLPAVTPPRAACLREGASRVCVTSVLPRCFRYLE